MGKTYFVYEHWTPSDEVYVGVTGQDLKERWKPSAYKGISLEPYINEFGWDNISHTVVDEFYTRDEALKKEDELIQYYREQGCCINSHRSGLIQASNPKEYNKQRYQDNKEDILAQNKQYREEHKEEIQAQNKQYYEANKEELIEYQRKLRSTPECKIYHRVHNYNQTHTPIITPKEARDNYINYGIIPNFIKHDDLEGTLYDPSDSFKQLMLF